MKLTAKDLKKPEVGSDGNIITPVEGEQLTPEEQAAQYAEDFGDNIEDLLNDTVIEEGFSDVRSIVQQTDDKGETTYVTPEGQVVGKIPEEKKPVAAPVKGTVKPQETKPEVDLSNYVSKEEHDKVVKEYNTLQGEFNKLKETANQGILNISDDDLNVIRTIKHDYENTPLGLIVEKYYQGQLEIDKLVPIAKPPQEQMPEGEQFDPTEAYTPGTASFKAREAFDFEKSQLQSQFKQAGEYITSLKQETKSDEDVKKEAEELDEKLMGELVSKVPIAKKHEDTFRKWLDNQDNIYLLAWVAYAQSVQNVVKRSKNVNTPLPGVDSIGTSDTPVVVEAERQMEEEFGIE
jgi:hypothetical protein